MFEPIMPYTNVDVFREKGAKNVYIKVWEPLNFILKNGSNRIIVDFFVVI
jgi:hypothetical protein